MRPAESLAARFRRFGERECAHVSPLYSRLACAVADDPELLAIAEAGDGRGQPVPNLLLGAVQLLLLGGAAHPLAACYPALGGDPTLPDAPARFRSFCLEHAAPIRAELRRRLVQTNEVRRCALTLPALALAAAGRPVALIEIGASAGLNLLLDHYAYQYGAQSLGRADAPLTIRCAPRGAPPPLPEAPPTISWRLGIDLQPIDLRSADAALWLRALVWPEQTERAALLERAIAYAQASPPPMRAGDGSALLGEAIDAAPRDAACCIIHTFTLNQLSPPMRAQLDATLAARSRERTLHVIGVEWREPMPPLTHTTWSGGERHERELATCDPHGAWIAWGAPPETAYRDQPSANRREA